jgi:glyceraldehyde-3-phosphate dehydrogenase type I
MRIAINGFGRIGRNFLRAVLQDAHAAKKLDVVAINIGPASIESAAHMFKYDTLMGIYPGPVYVSGNMLHIGEHKIQLLAKSDPALCNWDSYAIDWVVESSGHFTTGPLARKHIMAGAKHVLITAPAKEEDITVIPGINDNAYDPEKDVIVSLGSCTTNAFLPTLKVLNQSFGIIQGFMTTVHAYTNSQVLLDKEDGDLRRSRAAALNIIPTSTGASRVLDKVMPELKGKVLARAVRVPVGKVSLIDLVVRVEKAVTQKLVNNAFLQASENELHGILAFTNEPLVSSDYSGHPASVIIDGLLTDINTDMVKVFGWYDNEWGYSVRLKDFLMHIVG